MTTLQTSEPSARALAGLPPGPWQPPAWQLWRYSLRPLEFLENCHRRYGDPFTVRLAGYGKLVLLSSPEAVKDVFRGDARVLHSGEGNEFLSLSVGSNSVLVLDDAPHDRQRRVLLPPLKGERMRAFFTTMQQATLAETEKWPRERPIATDQAMRAITLRVILQAVLGLDDGDELRDLEKRIHHFFEHARGKYSLITIKLVPISLAKNARWMPVFRELARIDEAIYRIIASRREMPPAERGESVLADLLAARHDDGQPLSDVEIRDAVVTLLVAGHETTSIALTWAMLEIGRHPEVAARLADEVRTICGDELPSAGQLDELRFLDATIREVLRVRTILPFVVRLTKEPFSAGGREYPAGVMLSPCSHLIHRRPDLYPEPLRFRPERFLERKFSPYEWFPFGGGNRLCLGMAFAMHEMKVVLSTLLARLAWERPAEWRTDYVRGGVVLAPADGARVIIRNRKS